MSETMRRQAVASEEARFAAMAANDLDALESLLEDDLHYVHANGMVEDKAEFLRKIRSGERRYRRFESRSREVRHERGLSFVFGEAAVEVFTKVGLVQNLLVYTSVYRDAESPRLLAWHAVKAFGT
jgi:Domain of unknown function (DUF4440)